MIDVFALSLKKLACSLVFLIASTMLAEYVSCFMCRLIKAVFFSVGIEGEGMKDIIMEF